MIAVTPQMRVKAVVKPVDFRKNALTIVMQSVWWRTLSVFLNSWNGRRLGGRKINGLLARLCSLFLERGTDVPNSWNEFRVKSNDVPRAAHRIWPISWAYGLTSERVVLAIRNRSTISEHILGNYEH
jgi:hypothetical protein